MIRKIISQYKALSIADFTRKIILFIPWEAIFFGIIYRIKALIYLKSWNVRLGSNTKFIGQINNIQLGRNCRFYPNCVFELHETANISIGNEVVLAYGCIISIRKGLSIGDNTQIGEFSSIRDSTHSYSDQDKSIKQQDDFVKEISIGKNVWIGRNCLLLPGSVIGDNVIIGANTVVKGNLEDNSMYVGNPIVKIKDLKFN